MLCALSVVAANAAVGDRLTYDGLLNVTMTMDGESAPIVTDQASTVYLDQTESGYQFMLPSLSVLGMDLGDIVVDNVSYTDADGDGVYDFVGEVPVMALANNIIFAKVTLSGTEDTNANAISLSIPVYWNPDYTIDDFNAGVAINEDDATPIDVTFKGSRTSGSFGGVADAALNHQTTSVYGTAGAVVVNGYAGPVEVYSVDGRLVKSVVADTDSEIALAKGLYVVRAGNNVAKVIVK